MVDWALQFSQYPSESLWVPLLLAPFGPVRAAAARLGPIREPELFWARPAGPVSVQGSRVPVEAEEQAVPYVMY